jgi:hypothetical protein
MDLAFAQHAGTFGRDPEQVGGSRLVDLDKSAEHSGDQDRPAVVRLFGLIQSVDVGFVCGPFAGRRIDRT